MHFFGTTNLSKPLPRFAVFFTRPKSPDLRSEMKCCELILLLKLEAGKGFSKDLSKNCVGKGGEFERALDDATGTASTVRSCCEKQQKNFAKDAKILQLSNSAKLWKNISTSFCVCLVPWKERNLEIRANILNAFKMFGQRVASLVKIYT